LIGNWKLIFERNVYLIIVLTSKFVYFVLTALSIFQHIFLLMTEEYELYLIKQSSLT